MPARPHGTAMVEAEAAAWLARLQGRRDTAVTDRAFLTWLAEDEACRAAFDRATEIWDLLPGAVATGAEGDEDRTISVRRTRHPVQLAVLVSLLATVLFGGIAAWKVRPPVYETAVGQRRTIALTDGTRVSLNTDSEITVLYDGRQRRVRLDRGEALFEVRKDSTHPFIVVQADKQVRALGTVFLVRRDTERVAITLVEGRVEVTRDISGGRRQIAVLRPGERLSMMDKAGSVLDHPSLDVLMAWRKGEVMFDDVSLIDAASEFNRYAATDRLVVAPSAAKLRISGVFAMRDPLQFAATAAALYGLQVGHQDGEILISANRYAFGEND